MYTQSTMHVYTHDMYPYTYTMHQLDMSGMYIHIQQYTCIYSIHIHHAQQDINLTCHCALAHHQFLKQSHTQQQHYTCIYTYINMHVYTHDMYPYTHTHTHMICIHTHTPFTTGHQPHMPFRSSSSSIPASVSHAATAASPLGKARSLGSGSAAASANMDKSESKNKEKDLLHGVDKQLANMILDEVVDHSPGVSFDDIAGLEVCYVCMLCYVCMYICMESTSMCVYYMCIWHLISSWLTWSLMRWLITALVSLSMILLAWRCVYSFVYVYICI